MQEADECYDPHGPLLDLSALTAACRASASLRDAKARVATRVEELDEAHAKLKRLDAQLADMNVCILSREKELELRRAQNQQLERLTVAARAASVGLEAEHARALAGAAAAAARIS